MRFKCVNKGVFIWQDSEFLRNTRSHPDVVKNLFHSKKITRVEQEDWFNHIYSKDENYKIWIVYDEKKEIKVGYVQFHIDSIIHRRAEVGYVVVPSCQGQGYGRKMVEWSINNAIQMEEEGVKIHRLWLTVFPENEGAVHLYSKCGFEIDGIIRDYAYKDGIYRNVYIMSILL